MTRIITSLFFVFMAAASGIAQAQAPAPPTNLAATVSGSTVTLTWTASAGATTYIVQAGTTAGATTLTVPVATTGLVASAGAGTYFVRVVAVNASGQSVASNEVVVVVGSTGCTVPAAPRYVRGTIRGGELYLAWNRVNGATSYIVQAGASPGTTFQSFTVNGTALNASVGAGTYYVRVIARNSCGSSGVSEEATLSFPSSTVRVADPAAGGSLPLPDFEAKIRQLAAARPDLMRNASCPNPNSKYILNDWLNYMVDALRQYDTRWGYNAKPTRTAVDNGGLPVVVAGDEIAYYAGAGNGEGSANAYFIDILFSHCGANPEVTYRDFTGQEPGIWTGAGRFVGDQRQ